MSTLNVNSHYGNGFALLPWVDPFTKGEMPCFPDSWLAVWPVIAAHANQEKEAWPGFTRICALSGVGRSTVSEAIKSLKANEWITCFTRNKHNVYRLLYDFSHESRKNIAIHLDIIFSGVWGKMRHSDRKVYLILRAFAWHGGNAIPDGFLYPEGLTPEELIIFKETNFLPTHQYDAGKFIKLSGLPRRTYFDSYRWLIENALVIPTCRREETLEEGFLLPFRPGLYAPDIVEKIAEPTKNPVKIRPGAKRSFSNALRLISAIGQGERCKGKRRLVQQHAPLSANMGTELCL